MDVKTFPLHRYRLWALACFVALAAGRELDGKIHTLTHVTGSVLLLSIYTSDLSSMDFLENPRVAGVCTGNWMTTPISML